MEIIIDNRERQLIQALGKITHGMTLSVQTLDIGDIIVKKNGVERIIIERKTLYDLASSIKDGRYHEQSLRLSQLATDNHNIVYLIEGNLQKYHPPPIVPNPISRDTLMSSIISLMHFKGFSVLRTESIQETIQFLHTIHNKIGKEDRTPWYNGDAGANTGSAEDYLSTIKTVKQSNITPDNINIIMLAQIPSISTTTASHILSRYETLSGVELALRDDPCCLDDFKYVQGNQKSRRISKKVIQNIKIYLKI
jgi:ERCC4-type nuclease